MIEKLILKTRSYRRFYQNVKISRDILKELIDLARNSASAANLQPLKYIISNEPEKNKKIFPCTAWAGYIENWEGPEEGERPSAYIIILGDREIKENIDCDHGIAAQSIMLGATEKGLGGCMIGAIDRERLRENLEIPERYKIMLILALGKPNERVVLETAEKGNIKYWRDKNGVHHVPKRPLDELILSTSNFEPPAP